MKNTSKWQTHLPYVHVETFRAHNSLSNTFKRLNQLTTNKQTSSWVTAELVMRMHSSPRASSERIRQASERPTIHQVTKKLQRSFLGYIFLRIRESTQLVSKLVRLLHAVELWIRSNEGPTLKTSSLSTPHPSPPVYLHL